MQDEGIKSRKVVNGSKRVVELEALLTVRFQCPKALLRSHYD